MHEARPVKVWHIFVVKKKEKKREQNIMSRHAIPLINNDFIKLEHAKSNGCSKKKSD